MPLDQAPLAPGNPSESSGTLNMRDDNVSSNPQPTPHAPCPSSLNDGQEQALDSNRVIELQAFSERKAWIENKIKFLEKMPPIEVFVGLDSVRSSAEEVPGLPTRAELQQWLSEHDIIEKETEIFDSGELKQLKMFTKAATQRNLSPEDTDLIELTLTTIYQLDKLLHLLRDRSENLDLLGVRLTWEEYRTSAWIERRTIIADLKAFLDSRARWSPDVYESAPRPEDSPILNRRGSIASMVSVASDTSVSSAAFSRSARFKLAELLSRDAAHFAARVSTLRHGKIAPAGKALDKLIEHSRKPVPDELLDEQDRLEEKGITDLEHIGKFVMNVIMQWRKADEIYVETMKDQTAAQNLFDEIETAMSQHPTARQSTAFITRADALTKRLSLRGNPAAPTSTFPRPTHPLFPDQPASNESLAVALSSDIATATNLAGKVDAMAKEYRTCYEAVRSVETSTQAANDISTTFVTIIERLENGIPTSEGDGSPPNLMSETCLEVARHSVFLALLPSILDEREQANAAATQILRTSRAALLRLDFPNIDPSFKTNAASEILSLSTLRDQAQVAGDDVIARVGRLREARKIWAVMGGDLKKLEDIQRQVGDIMERERWKPHSIRGGTPPTPESPSATLPSAMTSHADITHQLDDFGRRLSQDVDLPLEMLSQTIEAPLNEWLLRSADGLKSLLESVKQMANLMESIHQQATTMGTIREEFNDLQIRIEDFKRQSDSSFRDALTDEVADDALRQTCINLATGSKAVRDDVQAFIDKLSHRVPFVANHSSPAHHDETTFVKRRFSSGDLKLGAQRQKASIELPFELASLDDAVRVDSNSYAMRLGGELEIIEEKGNHFLLACMAKEVDVALLSISNDINRVTQELSALKQSMSSLADNGENNLLDSLHNMSKSIEIISKEDRTRIARSFSPVRGLLHRMESTPGVHHPAVHQTVYMARTRAVDDAELRLNAWNEDVATFRELVAQAAHLEAQRLEQARLDEERRVREEKDRIAAEAAKKVRLEQERKEQERMAEQIRVKEEMDRLAAEEAENTRLEQIRLDEERATEILRLEAERKAAEAEKARLEEKQREEERLAEEARLQAEAERRALEEYERARLEEERLQEERLAEQLRVRAETERKAAEEAEKTRLEEERLEQLVQARVAEELRSKAESERKAAEAAEKARLEQERLDQERIAEELRLQAQKAAAEQAERAKLEQERLELARVAEELRLQAERERKLAEDAEKARLEHERLEQMVQIRVEEELRSKAEAERKAAQEATMMRLEQERFDQERIAEEAKAKLEEDRLQHLEERPLIFDEKIGNNDHDVTPRSSLEQIPRELDDIFGWPIASSRPVESKAVIDLKGNIMTLRKRLRSININEIARPPTSASSSNLPTQVQAKRMAAEYGIVVKEVARLPSLTQPTLVDMELRSLRSEIEASAPLMQRVQSLANLANAIFLCDAALSDLLEHIDSFPASPLGSLSSSYVTPVNLPPEEQLSARVSFTKSAIDAMSVLYSTVSDDSRAAAERERVLQTWNELEDMSNDRIGGRKSRPGSVLSSSKNSSGRNSSASGVHGSAGIKRPSSRYSNLSVQPASRGRGRGRLLPPSQPTRRVVSGSARPQSRPSSQMSTLSSNRSVSGPLNHSLYGSTFASRQRTTSLSTATITPTQKKPSLATPVRARALTGQTKRISSPTPSDTSSYSHSFASRSVSSATPSSSWSRAPRHSLSTIPMSAAPPRTVTPHRKAVVKPKKTYVPNPKNKLDVAVGDVVNKLPVNINVEVVAETWKDQSGKYWIGDSEPKLCFCRILRSQTVMVRVGGGWSELSRFIKDHFADAFRLLPDSPPRNSTQEEKWISSTTLLEAPEITMVPPRTPEPKGTPSFSLLTPGGSPQSMKSSTSAKGSPLTPLQFLRRADAEADMNSSLLRPVTPSSILRPLTPSKSTGLQPRNTPPHTIPHTPSRTSVWKP